MSAAVETIAANIYDYPAYYDAIFGAEWKAEFEFLVGCFERYTDGPVDRVFEPACGTGRLLYRLAKAGYDVGGLDLNPRAIAYCQQRLKRHGLTADLVIGDMADFSLDRPVDAAFNLINSFRHLDSDAAAIAHLGCVAAAVRPGGLYLLGLHLTPTGCPPMEEESWSARRGSLKVRSHLRTTERNVRRRTERIELVFDVEKPSQRLRLRDEFIFRTYTWQQMNALIDAAGEWEIAETFDFRYRLEQPLEMDAGSEDVVYVLRRRG